MSLLMRALERATRDRSGAQAPDFGANAHRDLTLEPLAAGRRGENPSVGSVVDTGPQWESAAPLEPPAVAGRASYPRPLTMFILAALLFGAGYGYYVYRELNGLNAPTPPASAKAAPLPAQGAATSEPSSSVTEPLATTRLIERPATSAAPARASEPIAAKPVAARAAMSEPAAATAPAAAGSAAASAAPAAPSKPAAPVTAPSRPPPQQTIAVTRSTAPVPTVSPALMQAYAALQDGRYDEARHLYTQLERSEPRNIDVLLGLAAVAVHQGNANDAAALYLRIMEIDPRNGLAQAGLLSLVGQVDAIAAESRLKRLLEREPSAFLYFTLGNLYAGQLQWASAQQAYFRAYHLDPGNADYAYNLAVGLEHVGQHQIALGFYRRAIELARQTGRANFNPTQAEQRISQLSAPE